MSNFVYDKALEAFANGTFNLLADNIKPVLVNELLYTPNQYTHEFLSDIPVLARVYTGPNLSGKTTTSGILDSDDTVCATVNGATCQAVVLFVDSGLAGTSHLLCHIDTNYTGLPFTPTGADVTLRWPVTGIFKV